MGLFIWICLGLVGGIIARLLLPVRDPGGIFLTTVLGMKGAVLGGCLGTILDLGDLQSVDVRSLFIAAAGALMFLIGYRVWKATGRRGSLVHGPSLEN